LATSYRLLPTTFFFVKISHTDFRPKKRSGVVPSGKPRRKIPLLRILLLIAAAFFIYTKFDVLAGGVRALNPAALWQRVFGSDAPVAANVQGPAWSSDSSEFSLDCPRGLQGCCDPVPASGAGICREALALLTKARSRGALGAEEPGSPLRLHARAASSRTGQEVFHLAALQGRTRGSTYAYQRNTAGSWCDGRRGCLSVPSPRAPLSLGRLLRGSGAAPDSGDGLSWARWVSASSPVHPVLPGRIVSLDSAGRRLRVYHGGELYTTYQPLRLAAGLRVGAPVTPGTVLGEAPWLATGYTIYVRAVRAGLNQDPGDFFSVQPLASAETSTDSVGTEENADKAPPKASKVR
jgi:hypothetical protein